MKDIPKYLVIAKKLLNFNVQTTRTDFMFYNKFHMYMKAYFECSMNWQYWFISIIFVVEFHRDINVTFESLIVVMTRTIPFHHDVTYKKNQYPIQFCWLLFF